MHQPSCWFASPWVTYAACGSAAALVLFTWRELRFPEPVVDLRILKKPMFTTLVILVVLMSFATYGPNLLNPIFLQEFMGYTAWKAGLALAPRAAGTLLSLIFIGQLSRLGYNTRPFIAIGFAIMAMALWRMSHWNLQIGIWQVVWPVVLHGLGGGARPIRRSAPLPVPTSAP